MRRLVILGAGGHGRVVADAAELAGVWSEIVFLDDRFGGLTRSGPWPVVGTLKDVARACGQDDQLVCAIGVGRVRRELQERLQQQRYTFANVVHPRATVSRHAQLGEGVVVFAGACINFGARLGDAVIVNTGATIDHDCVLEDGSHVCPGAHLAGDVKVGREAWIGIGASVRQGVSIGNAVTVGAGAAVVADVPDATLVVGVPARAKA
jgi:sugar O-acyltransferase (sialic acid O-acetyltransferase NeuD family)